MNSLPRLLSCAILALTGAASPALAGSCQADLVSARPGMIAMGGAARAERLTSREALAMIERGGSLSFRRDVPDFWRIKVRRSVDPADLDIRYRIEGGDGRGGNAVHRGRDEQKFPVRLIAGPAKVLCENQSYRIISGGFTALARASNIGLSGIYALEIDVDVVER